MIRGLRALALPIVVGFFGPLGVASNADPGQTASLRYVGVLEGGVWFHELRQAFRQGLLDEGFVEGRDVVIEWRSAHGDYSRAPQSVADLIQHKVDVIVVNTTLQALAARHATSTIPIVMAGVTDPVGSGLVANLAHPGGNISGTSMMYADLSAKRLQLLKDAIPGLHRVAVMWNPDTPPHAKVIQELKAAAPSLAIELSFVSVRTPDEIGPAFSAVNQAHAQALYVAEDAFFWSRRVLLLKLGSKARLPVIYWHRMVAHEGGLMSYAPHEPEMARLAAQYVGRILKGAKPGDLPIVQPTQFVLVVNLKAAKALGIIIPESILLRADEVIR